MNSAAQSVSEATGVLNTLREHFLEDRGVVLSVDASACKGMLLRTRTGNVKHLSTKQLWAQGAIQSCGMETQKVPRASNAPDVLAHALGESDLREGLHTMGYHTPKEWSVHP